MQLEEINQKIPAEKEKLKKIMRQGQTMQTKQDVTKQRKILPANRGRMHEDIPTNACKVSKIILEQNMELERI